MTEQEERLEAQQIDDGQRVADFVADPAVKAAMDKMKTQYFADFMAADNVDQMVLVKAKIKVLEDFVVELRKITHAGIFAQTQRDRREKSTRPASKRQS